MQTTSSCGLLQGGIAAIGGASATTTSPTGASNGHSARSSKSSTAAQLAGRQADRADLPAERLEDKAVITGAQHGAAADERTVDHHADTAPTATGEWYQGSQFSEIVDSYSKEQ